MHGSKRHTDVKSRLLDYVGEDKDGMIWEKSIEICILPCVKQMSSASLMREAGHSKFVLWDNPGEGGGRGISMGGHMCTCGWFMSMYGKNQHNIVKKLSSN